MLLNVGSPAGRIRGRIARPDETVHVPHLFDVEVLHVLRGHALRGVLSLARARLALGRLSAMRLIRYPHTPFAGRIWELRDSITAYDAAYVALAEALDAPLVTTDGRLTRAPGHRAQMELYS
jgi:predicted nucleic acid-binding protein